MIVESEGEYDEEEGLFGISKAVCNVPVGLGYSEIIQDTRKP
jgi:hypothetical protein